MGSSSVVTWRTRATTAPRTPPRSAPRRRGHWGSSSRGYRLERQRLPGLEQPHLDVGRALAGELRELLGAPPGALEPGVVGLFAGVGRAGHVERAPVDRHGDARLQQAERVGRGARAQMPALGRTHAPGLDGQQSEVDALVQVVHAVEQAGVAGEVDGRRALHDEPQRIGGRRDDPAPARVLGVHRHDLEVAEMKAGVAARLDDRLEADMTHGAAHVRGSDDDGRLGQQLERGRVEVVEVQVADQHDVDVVPDPGVGHLAEAPQRSRPAFEHRIGQDAQAVHLDQDGALTDVGHVRYAGRPLVSHGDHLPPKAGHSRRR